MRHALYSLGSICVGVLALTGAMAGSPQLPDGDFTISPPYAKAPELTIKDGVPKGTMHHFTMSSEDSKIYLGIGRDYPGEIVPYTRDVYVYVPAQYRPGTEAPFIVVQDGASLRYRNDLSAVLDNMIYEKRLPAMIGVLVHHGGGDAQGSERGLEYDTLSGTYAIFIEKEVLPRITREYGVKFTKNPDGRATMGGSSGAAAALTMAWFHPELYHRVLSYSGTFVNQQSPYNPESPRGAWEYHATMVPGSPVKPIRIWMEVGANDNGSTRDEASYHNWVLANRRMAAALKAKGYHYRFVFAEAAGHVDGNVVDQTLPEALQYVWEGYPIN